MKKIFFLSILFLGTLLAQEPSPILSAIASEGVPEATPTPVPLPSIEPTSSTADLAARAASEKLPQISASILRTQLQQETDSTKRHTIALRLAEILLLEQRPEEALVILNSEDLAPQKTRVLSKLAAVDEVQDASGRQNRSAHEVLEDSSTGVTQQFATAVEFGKNSREKPDTMVLFWKAQALLAEGHTAEAQLLFEQVLASHQLQQSYNDATQIALARIHRDQKEYDKALLSLETVSTSSSLATVALQERIASLLALNRSAEAEQLLQQKPELVKEPRCAYLLGLAAWQRGDATEALERWKSISTEDDWVYSAALSGIAACDIALHQPAEAQGLLEKYLQENPRSPRMPELMAEYEQLSFLQNNNDVTSFRKWAKDTTEPSRASYALLPYARMMRRLGHRDTADQLLYFFLTTYPHHPLTEEASLELAESKLLEGDPNSALSCVSNQENLPPAMQARYAFERGLAEITLNRLDAAGHDFGLAASLDPHLAADALYNQGLIQMIATAPPSEANALTLPNTVVNKKANASASEKAEYIAVLDKDKGDRKSAPAVIAAAHLFFKAHPDSPFANEVRMKLGEALMTSGNVREARVELETVAKAESSSELGRQALLLAAQAASRSMDSKSIDDALMLLEQVAQSSNAGPDAWQARLEQAALKNAQGLPLDAIAIEDQILTSSVVPLEIKRTAQMAKGDTLSGLGSKDPANYQAAIAIWRQLAEAPNTPAYWRNQALCKIGLIEEKLGENDAALAAYYEAMKNISSQEPEILWHDKAAFEAARLLEQGQQWGEAIRLYQQIMVENGPRASEAQARVRKLRLENFLWEK